MPFTASHPAAVLGLSRWGLPSSALVIGAIAPDLPMFLPFPAVVHVAHAPEGILSVDLALGLAAFVLWQALLAPALIDLGPSDLRVRLPCSAPAGIGFHFGRARRVALVMAAIGIGAVTHVLWDSFTHDWMFGVAHIPWLAPRHGPLMGFEWVRWVSDVCGLAIIASWVLWWWRGASSRRPKTTAISMPYRMLAWLRARR